MTVSPDALMLFAAGFGTRMGALTADRPKPLIEVAGRALLDHALDLARAARIPHVAVNAHYRADQIAAHITDRGIALSVETPEILDTGGGLRAALPLLGLEGPPEAVFTLNTDAVWTGPNPLDTLRAAWNPERMDALLLLVPANRAMGHTGPGDFRRAPGGRIERGAGYVYTGAQILKTAGLAEIPDQAFSLNRLWDAMARGTGLCGVVHRGGWCDVGRPEGIALADDMLARPPELLP